MKTSLVGLDEIEVKSEERSCVEPEGNWCLKGDDNDRREGELCREECKQVDGDIHEGRCVYTITIVSMAVAR